MKFTNLLLGPRIIILARSIVIVILCFHEPLKISKGIESKPGINDFPIFKKGFKGFCNTLTNFTPEILPNFFQKVPEFFRESSRELERTFNQANI